MKQTIIVYNLTVQNKLGVHNFLTAAGIVLKNCGDSCHDSTQASGSGTVFANGLPVARVGDSIACGSSNQTGSGNHFTGG